MIKIAVIDDEKDLIKALKTRIENKGYTALIAYDGPSGLELVRKKKPDLVILDIMMPSMDGRDVLIELKKGEDTKDIPVIMLTCKTEQFDRDYAFSLKADAYIEKPYEQVVLFREVSNLLRKSKGMKTA